MGEANINQYIEKNISYLFPTHAPPYTKKRAVS